MTSDQFLYRLAQVPASGFLASGLGLLAAASPEGRRLCEQAAARIGRIAGTPARAIAACIGTSLILSAALAVCAGWPQPNVHDEFSNLLAADTFAHGRLTNPTHPMWRHFETVHVIQKPTYMSKYPPGQGLFLALGQVLTGHPIVGAWLSVALGCGAVAWMLLFWVPVPWALAGGLLAALHPIVVSWTFGYRGGGVAFLGGALALGAAARILKKPRALDAVLLGTGLALLANSRPFEGLVFSVPLAAALGKRLWERRREGLPWKSLLLPAGGVLAAAAAFMLYYNWRVTGDALKLPYMVHEETYSMYPTFVWQDARPAPEYRHKMLFDMHAGWEFSYYKELHTPRGFVVQTAAKFGELFAAYFHGGLLFLPFLAAVWAALDDRRTARLVAYGAGFIAATMAAVWSGPQYVAPGAGLFFLVTVLGLRRLKEEFERGPLIVNAVALAAVPAALLFAKFLVLFSSGMVRPRIAADLEAQPGKQLVLIRYGPGHYPNDEWVYNAADIDAAKIVWARSMSPKEDAELKAYFKDREVRPLMLEMGVQVRP